VEQRINGCKFVKYNDNIKHLNYEKLKKINGGNNCWICEGWNDVRKIKIIN
jgi:hypothetical protein